MLKSHKCCRRTAAKRLCIHLMRGAQLSTNSQEVVGCAGTEITGGNFTGLSAAAEVGKLNLSRFTERHSTEVARRKLSAQLRALKVTPAAALFVSTRGHAF